MRPVLSHTGAARLWLEAQTSTHQQRVRVRVMNLDHRVLADSTHMFIGGDVTIDVSREVSRVLRIRLLDPSRSIGWEPESVVGLPRYSSRMLRVDVQTRVPELDDWIEVPVFTGPVVDFDRTGVEVKVVAHSKERLALGNFGRARTFRRKQRATVVIKQMLREAGETRLGQIPNLPDTLPEDITVNRGDKIWVQATQVAKSIDRILEYDTRGRPVLREQPRGPKLTIIPEWLTEPVQVDRQSIEQVHNRWIVRGPKPKGNKRRVRADVRLPKQHPLSAQSLGRNGEPLWRIEAVDRHGVKTKRRARRIGRRIRDEQLRNRVDFTVDCLNLPHLAEWDLVRVQDPYAGTFWLRVRQATIPLDGSPMTIGSLKRPRTTRPGRRMGPRY